MYLDKTYGSFFRAKNNENELHPQFLSEEIAALRNDADESLAFLRGKETKTEIKFTTLVFLLNNADDNFEITYRVNGSKKASLIYDAKLGLVHSDHDSGKKLDDTTIKSLCDMQAYLKFNHVALTTTNHELAILLRAFTIPRMSLSNGKQTLLTLDLWIKEIKSYFEELSFEEVISEVAKFKYLPNRKQIHKSLVDSMAVVSPNNDDNSENTTTNGITTVGQVMQSSDTDFASLQKLAKNLGISITKKDQELQPDQIVLLQTAIAGSNN
jgi:hypothetical protein